MRRDAGTAAIPGSEVTVSMFVEVAHCTEKAEGEKPLLSSQEHPVLPPVPWVLTWGHGSARASLLYLNCLQPLRHRRTCWLWDPPGCTHSDPQDSISQQSCCSRGLSNKQRQELLGGVG